MRGQNLKEGEIHGGEHFPAFSSGAPAEADCWPGKLAASFTEFGRQKPRATKAART